MTNLLTCLCLPIRFYRDGLDLWRWGFTVRARWLYGFGLGVEWLPNQGYGGRLSTSGMEVRLLVVAVEVRHARTYVVPVHRLDEVREETTA